MIEARAYGPESTTGERQALRRRVRRLSHDVILYEEVPVQSHFQIDLMFERLTEVSQGLDQFYYVISLCDAGRPTADTREHIKQRFREFHPRIQHTSVYTGKNFMLNVAIKFVFNGFGLHSYSIHRSLPQALDQIEYMRGLRAMHA